MFVFPALAFTVAATEVRMLPRSKGNFIKIDRKIENWRWFQSSYTFHVFMYLLINAKYADEYYKGYTIHRGQLITGRKKISEKTGISEPQVQRCLASLVETGEIRRNKIQNGSLVTIVNYDKYQGRLYHTDTNGDTNGDTHYKKPPKGGKETAGSVKTSPPPMKKTQRVIVNADGTLSMVEDDGDGE